MVMAMRRGFGETLQAVGGHKFADVLAEPGENRSVGPCRFHGAGRAARHGGAAVYGPRAQGEFLVDLGITARAEKLIRPIRPRRRTWSRAWRG